MWQNAVYVKIFIVAVKDAKQLSLVNALFEVCESVRIRIDTVTENTVA